MFSRINHTQGTTRVVELFVGPALMSFALQTPSQQKWVSESIVSWERDCVFGGRGRRTDREYSATPG